MQALNRLASTTVVVAAGLCIRGFAVAPQAQQPPPPAGQQKPPVFRSGTTLVPLTVTVLGRDGKPVSDLTQADFSVTENGKPREIVSFFPQPIVAGEVTPIEKMNSPEARSPWQQQIAPKTSRSFLFVLGFGGIE